MGNCCGTGSASKHQNFLPPEVWEEIVSYLSTNDLKTVRLLNTSFCKLTTKFLVGKCYCALTADNVRWIPIFFGQTPPTKIVLGPKLFHSLLDDDDNNEHKFECLSVFITESAPHWTEVRIILESLANKGFNRLVIQALQEMKHVEFLHLEGYLDTNILPKMSTPMPNLTTLSLKIMEHRFVYRHLSLRDQIARLMEEIWPNVRHLVLHDESVFQLKVLLILNPSTGFPYLWPGFETLSLVFNSKHYYNCTLSPYFAEFKLIYSRLKKLKVSNLLSDDSGVIVREILPDNMDTLEELSIHLLILQYSSGPRMLFKIPPMPKLKKLIYSIEAEGKLLWDEVGVDVKRLLQNPSDFPNLEELTLHPTGPFCSGMYNVWFSNNKIECHNGFPWIHSIRLFNSKVWDEGMEEKVMDFFRKTKSKEIHFYSLNDSAGKPKSRISYLFLLCQLLM